jgi:photosystem II stability/assembly factor-like uncharacterized protein
VDGGQTWQMINENLRDEWVHDQFFRIEFPSTRVGYYFGSVHSLFYKTVDGGKTWAPQTIPGGTRIHMVTFYNENIGMAISWNPSGPDSTYRTLDGGDTWTCLPVTSKTMHHDIEFVPGDSTKVWLTDYDHFYYSEDMGDTWQEINLDSTNLRGRNIEFFNTVTGFLLCDDSKLFYTNNLGGMLTSVEPEHASQPDALELLPNYPNPFNPSTQITFVLPRPEHVTVKAYNMQGQCVATLMDGQKTSGPHQLEWNAAQLASGIYFIRVQASEQTATQKCLLMK